MGYNAPASRDVTRRCLNRIPPVSRWWEREAVIYPYRAGKGYEKSKQTFNWSPWFQWQALPPPAFCGTNASNFWFSPSHSYKQNGSFLIHVSLGRGWPSALTSIFQKRVHLSIHPLGSFWPYTFSLKKKNLFTVISEGLGRTGTEIKTGLQSLIIFNRNWFCPFYRCDSWGTGRLNNLHKVSQQVSGRARRGTQTSTLPM